MVKLLSNGKKAVKFFIRLLPILYLIFIFMVFVFGDGLYVDYLQQDIVSHGQDVLYLIDFGSGLWDSLFENFYSLFGFLNPLREWFTNTLFNGNPNYFFDISFSICCYELWVSFVFLCFDILNYMFTIAERFLNKEERLSEK